MNSRRDFLQKLTGSAIALTILPGHTPAAGIGQPSVTGTSGAAPENIGAGAPEDRTADGPLLRVAIMGLGSYGTRVAEAMQSCKKARLAGIISGTPSKIAAWKTQYNIPDKNCYNYSNFDNIKDTPTSTPYMSLLQRPA